jgi:hypothetical protein
MKELVASEQIKFGDLLGSTPELLLIFIFIVVPSLLSFLILKKEKKVKWYALLLGIMLSWIGFAVAVVIVMLTEVKRNGENN